MTVAVKQRPPLSFSKGEGETFGSFLQEKLFEQEARLSLPLSVIAAEKFHRFIAQEGLRQAVQSVDHQAFYIL